MPNLFPENAYILLDGETEKRYADENGSVIIRSEGLLTGIAGGINSTVVRFSFDPSFIDTENDVLVEIPIRTFILNQDYGELSNAYIKISGETENHNVVNGTVDIANGNLIQVSIVADNCKTIEDELTEITEHTEYTYTLQFQFLRTFNILLEDNTVPTNAYIQVTGEVDPRFADENGVISFRTSDAISGIASSSDSGVFASFNYAIITTDTVHNITLYTPYVFADPVVQSIVVANWGINSYGVITRPEINAITNLNLKFKQNTSITSFNELQDFNGLKSLSLEEFSSCTSLTSITFPNSLTSIGGYAFYNCSSLRSIEIPSGVTSIGNAGFSGCNSLRSIEIPNSVTSIGSSAFYNCTSLTSIQILATTPPTLSTNAFTNTNNCPIYIPTGTLAVYSAATNWSAHISRFIEY